MFRMLQTTVVRFHSDPMGKYASNKYVALLHKIKNQSAILEMKNDKTTNKPVITHIKDKRLSTTQYLYCGVPWNGILYLSTVDYRVTYSQQFGNLLMMDNQGEELDSQQFEFSIRHMVVWNDLLWVASGKQGVSGWKRSGQGCKIELAKTLTPNIYSEQEAKLCVWGGNRLAAIFGRSPNVLVWSSTYENIFSLSVASDSLQPPSVETTDAVCPNSLAEWKGKLVCGTQFGNHIFVWNWDGSLFQKIVTHNTCLAVAGDKLWQVCGARLSIWEDLRDWNVERLLWIGWKKNVATESVLSTLPKDLIRLIISFVWSI